MNRDYVLVSPSLYGILRHDSLGYEGVERPEIVSTICDRPGGTRPEDVNTPQKKRAVEQYFNDLYTIFMKRLTNFVAESKNNIAEEVRLQAMFQEMIKIKRLLNNVG